MPHSAPLEAESCRRHPRAPWHGVQPPGGTATNQKAAGDGIWGVSSPLPPRCGAPSLAGPATRYDCCSCWVTPAPGLQPSLGSSHCIPCPFRHGGGQVSGERPLLPPVPRCLHISVSPVGFLNPLHVVPPSMSLEAPEWNAYAAGTLMATGSIPALLLGVTFAIRKIRNIALALPCPLRLFGPCGPFLCSSWFV